MHTHINSTTKGCSLGVHNEREAAPRPESGLARVNKPFRCEAAINVIHGGENRSQINVLEMSFQRNNGAVRFSAGDANLVLHHLELT